MSKCYICGKLGHYANECCYKHSGVQGTNRNGQGHLRGRCGLAGNVRGRGRGFGRGYCSYSYERGGGRGGGRGNINGQAYQMPYRN